MKRSTLITLAILVVLLIAYLLMNQSEKRSLSVKETSNWLGVDSGLVTKISVRRLGAGVDFEKVGESWNVIDRGKSYPTEKGTVEQLANLAHALSVGEIIGSNPEKQMLFQVDTIAGSTITFYRDGNPLATMIVGKMGADYQTTYVRKPDSKNVYSGKGNFARLLNRPASGYRDKTLLTVDTTQIVAMTFKSKDVDYRIGRQDSLWRVVTAKGNAFSPNPGKMSNVLRQLAMMRWNDAVAEGDTARPNFLQPAVQIEIAMTDGSTNALKFVAQNGGDQKSYYVQSPAGDETFLVNDYVVNNLVKKPEELK